MMPVDDDQTQLTIVSRWLESIGYEVHTHDSPVGTTHLVKTYPVTAWRDRHFATPDDRRRTGTCTPTATIPPDLHAAQMAGFTLAGALVLDLPPVRDVMPEQPGLIYVSEGPDAALPSIAPVPLLGLRF